MMSTKNNVNYLPWDSENFGFKVGKLIINDLHRFSWEVFKEYQRTNGYKLIYLISPIKLYINAFYDYKLTYSKNRTKNNHIVSDSHIHSYKDRALSEQLLNLALESGKYSRYHLDEQFPSRKFEFLYKKWLENSLLTDYASDVLVYELNNKPVGLLTYKVTGEQTSIGIIATDSKYQGRGIGSALMRYYDSILPDSIETLEVVTQGVNLAARSFYEKFGYAVKESCYVYHIWSK